MHKVAKNAIHDLTLKLRKTLEAEVERELGRYGIYPEREWIDPGDLPRLSEEERDEHRPRIEATIGREQEAGLKRKDAVRAFIRETAYTHMNRLLGLKCMGVRGLIKETITTRDIYSGRSERHRDYLDEHPRAMREPDQGLATMLQQAYEEVSRTIGVLFDPDSDYSIVWPRHTVLADCIQWINNVDSQVARELEEEPEELASVYTDDTILGWVYQYFQEEEKDRVFRDVRTKKKKISGHDIIPATSLYTERYMVQFLVENSLGALWMEMYPESDLHERWEYFVRDPNLQNEDGTWRQGRDPKSVSEITLLDPACGSGHFLLYAFDLFAQMYEAEAKMQRQLMDKEQVARDILRHNLYGIDIDLRSIQLSALNLYMKACEYASLALAELRNSESVQVNLVCADIVLQEGHELEVLLGRFDEPENREVMERLVHSLRNARELGSLLKIGEPLDELVARKRSREKGTLFERPAQMWQQWRHDFLRALQSFTARTGKSYDVNQRMFGREAVKGAQLLELLSRRYEIVATNPPYMSSRNMGEVLRGFLRDNFTARSDLYGAFIQRCGGLTNEAGLTAMITQQSFLFLSSFEELRRETIESRSIRSLVQLGPGAFSDISGEKVNTAMFVLRSGSKSQQQGRFIRLNEASNKAQALLGAVRNQDNSPRVWDVSVQRFSAIPKFPFVYWIPEEIVNAFENHVALETVFETNDGNKTAHNARYIRYWWEVQDRKSSRLSAKWRQASRVETQQPFYGNYNEVVDWSDSARAFYSSNSTSNLLPQAFWNTNGITFSRVTSSGFTARHLPKGHIADVAATAIYPKARLLWYLLGFLNSTTAVYLLDLLNPTINYSIGDLARVPFIEPDSSKLETVAELAKTCVRIKSEQLKHELISRDFKANSVADTTIEYEYTLKSGYLAFLKRRARQELAYLMAYDTINLLCQRLYGLSRNSDDLDLLPSCLFDYPILADYGEVTVSEEHKEWVDACPRLTVKQWASDYETGKHELDAMSVLKQKFSEHYMETGLSLETLSQKLYLNPISVCSLYQEFQLVREDDFTRYIEDFVCSRVWSLLEQDANGLIPYSGGLEIPPIVEQIRGDIETIFGTERALDIEAELDAVFGRGGLVGWLENPFFKKHISQFNKRPILWQITSPQQKFRVLVYYQKLDRDTLPKIRSKHLSPLLTRARSELKRAKEQDPENMKAIGDLEEYIADLEECDRLLDSVIQGTVEVELPEWASGPYRKDPDGTRHGPYDPDLDDGVKVNILPLQAAGLLPYKKVV